MLVPPTLLWKGMLVSSDPSYPKAGVGGRSFALDAPDAKHTTRQGYFQRHSSLPNAVLLSRKPLESPALRLHLRCSVGLTFLVSFRSVSRSQGFIILSFPSQYILTCFRFGAHIIASLRFGARPGTILRYARRKTPPTGWYARAEEAAVSVYLPGGSQNHIASATLAPESGRACTHTKEN